MGMAFSGVAQSRSVVALSALVRVERQPHLSITPYARYSVAVQHAPGTVLEVLA